MLYWSHKYKRDALLQHKKHISKNKKAHIVLKTPKEVEELVVKRDFECVYCGVAFNNNSRKDKASWEHIVNDIRINHDSNIALCCISCNASKGTKSLSDWLDGRYCKEDSVSVHNN